jgi:Bromodomain
MDTAIRRKRSHDGQASLRRAELEEQLAELRDQEAELIRAIELVVADEKAQKISADPSLPPLGEILTAEPKDYELKVKLVGENKRRRAKTFWGEVRKVITALKNVKNLNSVFGVPVSETLWGSVPKHYEHYLSVISRPMDLRTIKNKLGDDERGVKYTSPQDVADDIRLIADNCNKFNTGAQNEAVRKIAENLLQQFERKWRENAIEERWQKELAQQQLEAQV